MKNTINNSNGFTLLEMILSLSIVGIIVALALGGIRLGILSQEAGGEKVETFQRLRIIADQLSQKIKSNYPVFVVNEELSSPSSILPPGASPAQASRILAFEGTSDSIRLITFAGQLTSIEQNAWTHEVRFYLGAHPETREEGIIMMERDIKEGDAFTKSSLESKNSRFFLLANNVSALKFRYYQMKKQQPEENQLQTEPSIQYKGEWIDNIKFEIAKGSNELVKETNARLIFEAENRMTLPRAVEISIGILEPQQQDAENEATTVFSPPIIALLHAGMITQIPPKPKEDEKT